MIKQPTIDGSVRGVVTFGRGCSYGDSGSKGKGVAVAVVAAVMAMTMIVVTAVARVGRQQWLQ